MRKTIYDRDAWKFILEKYPKVKRLATELGLQNRPQKVEEMVERFKGFTRAEEFTQKEQELLSSLIILEFSQQEFLPLIEERGSMANLVGAEEDSEAAFQVALVAFDDAFNDFLRICKKRKLYVEYMSFYDAYKIFLEAIVLKMEYRIPLTKLFIKRLLEMRDDKEEFSIEIKKYLLEHNIEIFTSIRKDQLQKNSQNIYFPKELSD